MGTANVAVGSVYGVKVGNRMTEVKLIGVTEGGAWIGQSVKSGKMIRGRDATRLIADDAAQSIVQSAAMSAYDASHGNNEQAVLGLLEREGREVYLEDIVRQTGIAIGSASSALMLLELKGKVRQSPGKMFALKCVAAVMAAESATESAEEPHAFCCGCGKRLESRSKWYCGDDCKKAAKTSGVRHCWNCGKKVLKGMVCESC